MAITVKFFASLREQIGIENTTQPFREGMTPAALWEEVVPGQPLPGNVLVAVNMEYAGPEHLLTDGDEVAFFPPVTGGGA
ncbi:MAG: molybdopterin converting factor subunit 1 [Thiohalomonadaceae bacterium]